MNTTRMLDNILDKGITLFGLVFFGFSLLAFFQLESPIVDEHNTHSTDDWIAPAWTDTLKNPLTDLGKAARSGKKIFGPSCSICHGSKGKGDGIAGVALSPRPSDLRSDKVQAQSDGAIFWKLTTGRAPMPAYQDMLSEEKRWQMIAFIRSLKK